MSIRPLSHHVVNKIKSSIVITSLNAVATGLLCNSLDAGATKVNITLDYSRGNCTIEDNGLGILPKEFKEDGGLGKLHHTSRFPPSDHFHGKHGSFLASLATLSLLSISSRHHHHISHNSILIHNSAVLARHLPAPPEQALRAFEQGTRVIVRDLFGSIPVRVKQRSASLDAYKDWWQLIHDVVAILLSWSSVISVSLRESTTHRELRLKPPDKSDILIRTSRLLNQASFADLEDADSFIPISASARYVSVKGCFLARPVASRRSQFISFGIQPMSNEYGTNVIYGEVNKVFSNSSFGVIENKSADDREPKTSGFTGNEMKVRKGVERWPLFYLQIWLRHSDARNVDEILDNKTNDLAAILDLLKATCYGFLKKHHYRPRKVRMSAEESVFSVSGTLGQSKNGSKRVHSSTGGDASNISSRSMAESQFTRSESPFDSWQRVKVGHATGSAVELRNKAALLSLESDRIHKTRLVGEGGRLLRKPFEDPEEDIDQKLQQESDHFKNKLSGSDFGNNVVGSQLQPASIKSKTSTQTQEIRKRLAKRPNSEPSEWLKGVLGTWENPVFQNAPTSMSRAYNESSTVVDGPHASGRSRHFRDGEDCGIMFESASVNLNSRIAKSALSEADVISQVDRKFILVKLPLHDTKGLAKTSALVMLDQHAVDERCKLEDLMEGYFVQDSIGDLAADMEILEKPIVFEVSGEEVELLGRYQDYFAFWGIIYQSSSDHIAKRRTVTTSHFKVTSLPPSILERCRSEPRILIELLRKEAWHVSESGRPPKGTLTRDSTDHAWVSNFHGCPRGILELLHSRSCRSAIMFNDVLSPEECKGMVKRLARCAFPFQCAHGRPSMAPLVDLGVSVNSWDGDVVE